MRAGVAAARLEPPPGTPMMGYGARTGPARAAHDPLHARALFLEGGDRVLWLVLDVCLLSVPRARDLAGRVARRTGLDPGAVWIACTHTHSGPETGLAESLAGGPEPAHAAALWETAVDVAERAVAGAAPARAGLGRATVEIGRNRREAGGAVDPEVVVLRVDDEHGAPRAVAFVHGTHPTVLGHENLAWSADWPGAAARRVEAAFPGATALFLLGGHGDVDPRTRGIQDLAVAGQSLGAGFEAVEALGVEVGEAVVAAARDVRTRADLPVRAGATRVRAAVHGAAGGEAAREAGLARRAAEAARALELDPAEPVRVSRLLALERERTAGLAPEAVRERLARVRLYVRDRTAPRVAGGLHPEVEVRAVRLGDAAWLGLPAEATAELALEWKAGRPPGSALLSIVGGWLRYLPHPRRFEAPEASRHYEVLMSTLEPAAARDLLAAGEALLAGDAAHRESATA